MFTLTGSVCDAQINVALNKPATQSSTYERTITPNRGPREASVAVDGIPSQCSGLAQSDGAYSHTLERANSWWRVDLGQLYYIYDVTVCNRGGIFCK